jgi:hypothetical protein
VKKTYKLIGVVSLREKNTVQYLMSSSSEHGVSGATRAVLALVMFAQAGHGASTSRPDGTNENAVESGVCPPQCGARRISFRIAQLPPVIMEARVCGVWTEMQSALEDRVPHPYSIHSSMHVSSPYS